MSNRRFYSLLLLIMVFALLTRLTMINHHASLVVEDEGGDLSYALRLVEGEPPNLNTLYHRTFIIYHDLFAVGVYSAVKLATGQFSNFEDVRNAYFVDRQAFVIATRLWIITLTVLAVGLIGLSGRYLNPTVGILGALVFSLNMFATVNATYALPDALIMFAVAMLIWLTMRIYTYRRTRDYVAWGLLFVWVMMTKLIASPVAVGLVIAHTAIAWETSDRTWQTFLKRLIWNKNVWLTALAIVLGQALFNPFLLVYPDSARQDLGKLTGMFGSIGSPPHLQAYLSLIVKAFEQLVTLIWRWMLPFSVLGVVAVWVNRRSVPYWMMLAMFLAQGLYLLHNLTNAYSQVYYWTSWIVSMSLVAGMGLAYWLQWAKNTRGRVITYGVAGLLLIAEGLFLAQVIQLVQRPTTQDLARAYVQAHIPAHSKLIAGDGLTYSVPLQRDETSIQRATAMRGVALNIWSWYLSQPEASRPSPAYDIYGPEMQRELETLDDLRALIQREGIEYAITMEYCRGFTYSADSESALDYPPNSPDITQDWELLATFSPFASDVCENQIATRTGLSFPPNLTSQLNAGPILRIYRIR